MTREQLIRDFSTGAVPTGANFQSLINQTYNEGFVTSFNNTKPDSNGNIALNIDTDFVKTVNNTMPDANGNINITAGDGTSIPGPRGETGPQGERGEKGERGEGFVVSRTYTSLLEANNDIPTSGLNDGNFIYIASTTNDQENGSVYILSNNSYVFQFKSVGIRGEKGETGERGIQGERGQIGERGERGETGLTGPSGPRGENGSDANVTNQNVLGAIGYTPANVVELNSHISNNDIHKTSEIIRNESTTALRTEVVSSLPSDNLQKGRIVFLDDATQSFKGYNGGEWL